MPQRGSGHPAAFGDFRDAREVSLSVVSAFDLQVTRRFTVVHHDLPLRFQFVTHVVSWLERHQILFYLAAIAIGGGFGMMVDGAHHLGAVIEPVLALLLFATFLGVPFAAIGRSLRDARFLGAVGVLNFVVVPLVAYGLSRFVMDEPALLFGVLLVLLTPCIDYVIVFAGLAGGAAERLLAAAPLLMLAQILLLPVYLLVFIGPGGVAVVEVAPFARAFVLLIVIPLTAAVVTQWLAKRHHAGHLIQSVMLNLMVPLMIATLFTVVASQAGAVGAAAVQLLTLVPIYVAFLVIMVVVGLGAGRLFRLDVPATRALVLSGATRNSLVVLPMALALPGSLALVPVVVVTQTLIELVGMVVLVRIVPRLVRSPEASRIDLPWQL